MIQPAAHVAAAQGMKTCRSRSGASVHVRTKKKGDLSECDRGRAAGARREGESGGIGGTRKWNKWECSTHTHTEFLLVDVTVLSLFSPSSAEGEKFLRSHLKSQFNTWTHMRDL